MCSKNLPGTFKSHHPNFNKKKYKHSKTFATSVKKSLNICEIFQWMLVCLASISNESWGESDNLNF